MCSMQEKSKIPSSEKWSFLEFWIIFDIWCLFYSIYQWLKSDEAVAKTVLYQMRRLRAQTIKPFLRKSQNTKHTLL
jgi:hypothetical protein